MHKQMKNQRSLWEVLKKYSGHPEFLGIDLQEVNQKGAVDNTALHLAAGKNEVDDIKILVDNGADVNMPGDLGNTPLHFAALMGRAEAVKVLLKLKARANLLNEFEQTPLDVARLGGHGDVVAVLEGLS